MDWTLARRHGVKRQSPMRCAAQAGLLRCRNGSSVMREDRNGARRLWPASSCSEGELQSALLNLAPNARDVMPNGGKLVMATGTITVDAISSVVPPGENVALSV